MRILTLFAVSSIAMLSMGANTAFAEMDANEILQRLKRQAEGVGTLQVEPQSTQRGLRLNYGSSEPAPTAAPESMPSALAVPVEPAPSIAAAPAVPVMETETAATVPAMPSIAVRAPEPQYEQVTLPEPAVAAIPETAPAAPSVSVTSTPIIAATRPTVQSIDLGTIAAPAQAPVPQLASVSEETYSPVSSEARIDLPIYFDWNSTALRPDAIAQLGELCTAIHAITADGSRKFKIIGHTDKSGEAAYNLYLSGARAREVKRHLIEECSLPEASLIATGEGERQSPQNTPNNAPAERRVEVQLVS